MFSNVLFCTYSVHVYTALNEISDAASTCTCIIISGYFYIKIFTCLCTCKTVTGPTCFTGKSCTLATFYIVW